MEAKLPKMWTEGKAQPGRSSDMKKFRREKTKFGEDQGGRKSEERRCRGAKGRKVAKHCMFPMFCGSGGWKGRLAKAAGAEPASQMRDEKKTRRCSAKHIWKQKVPKRHHVRTTFGS